MILTARKQLGNVDTSAFFKAWSPTPISPEDRRNKEDMAKLLTLRLEADGGHLVTPDQRIAAVRVLAEKSKVGGSLDILMRSDRSSKCHLD